MNEVRLDTYNKCVNSYKQAKKTIDKASHQLYAAINAARQFYIDEHGNEHGFVRQFAKDCGLSEQHISHANTVSKSEVMTRHNFSELGMKAAYAFVKAPESIQQLAEQALDDGHQVTEKDIKRWVDGDAHLQTDLETLIDNQSEQKEVPKVPRKEPNYSKNPMNMKLLAVGVVETLRLLSTEDYAKDLTAEELAGFIWGNISGVGGPTPDPSWERHCIDSINASLPRLIEAAKLLPQVKPQLKRVK